MKPIAWFYNDGQLTDTRPPDVAVIPLVLLSEATARIAELEQALQSLQSHRGIFDTR